MKPSTAKAKGRQGQIDARDYLLQRAPGLVEDDIRSRPMGSPGDDLMLSPAAMKALFKGFKFDIEIKVGKAFNAVNACKQAEAEGRTGRSGLALTRYDIDKQDKRKKGSKPDAWFVCMRADVFFEIMNKLKE
jgi:hypothetical protein